MSNKFDKYIELDNEEYQIVSVSYTNMTQKEAEKVIFTVESELSRIFSLLHKTGYLYFATGEFEKDFVFCSVTVKFAMKDKKFFVYLERKI